MKDYIMDDICNFLLLFAKEAVLITIFLLGYFLYNRKLFFQAIVLLLLGLIVAAFIKHLFKVPLMPHLGEGWSFPSGHMFAACTFWGFLALELRNKIFSIFVTVLLIGIGFSLMHGNYHILIDVLAAVVFSFIYIILYRFLLSSTPLDQNNALLGLFAFLFGGLLIYSMPFKPIFYLPMGALLGLAIGCLLSQLSYFNKHISLLFEVLLCLAGLILIYYLSPFLNNPIISHVFLLYFLIGLWIIFGPKCVNILIKR